MIKSLLQALPDTEAEVLARLRELEIELRPLAEQKHKIDTGARRCQRYSYTSPAMSDVQRSGSQGSHWLGHLAIICVCCLDARGLWQASCQ